MVTVGMSYKVRPGKEEDFERVFEAVQRALQGMPCHLQTRLYRECGQSDYLIVSEWTERRAFEDFATSQLFRNVVSWGGREVLQGRPTHEIYESPEAFSFETAALDLAEDRRSQNGSTESGGCPFHADGSVASRNPA